MSIEDRRRLQAFIRDFEGVIEQAIRPSEHLGDSAATDLQAALDELRGREVFQQVIDALEDQGLDEAGPGTSMSILERSGLTGANLRLKLNGWSRALDSLSDSAAPSFKVWKSIFNWANTILGSLAAVVGAAESLKELKEAAENSYEDAVGDS